MLVFGQIMGARAYQTAVLPVLPYCLELQSYAALALVDPPMTGQKEVSQDTPVFQYSSKI